MEGGVGCGEAYGTMMYMLDLFIKIIKFEREKKVTEVNGKEMSATSISNLTEGV